MADENDSATDHFAGAVNDHIAVAQRVAARLGPAYAKMRDAWLRSIASGGKIVLFGNGGSAAQAQHIAAELVVRFSTDRAAIAAIALSTDTSILTAAGNDFGFDRIFSRQIEALGRPGDVAAGLSTSGRSPNVIAALKAARERGLVTTGLGGGDGGELSAVCDHVIVVPSAVTARIQEIHLLVGHMLCADLERHVLARTSNADGVDR
jgi:D-sedoheptulose 7-phosphate isomerase